MNMRVNVEVKKLYDDAIIPTCGSSGAAGLDLYAHLPKDKEYIVIAPHDVVKIGTGIAMALPEGTYGAIVARSGTALKKHLRPANCVGVIDEDYRGEIIVALHNDSDDSERIFANERIAQMVLQEYIKVNLTEVDTLDETIRGEGGFGSSGDR